MLKLKESLGKVEYEPKFEGTPIKSNAMQTGDRVWGNSKFCVACRLRVFCDGTAEWHGRHTSEESNLET